MEKGQDQGGIRFIGGGIIALSGTAPTGVHVLSGTNATVTISNMYFWGGGGSLSANKIAYMEGSGELNINNCRFRDWLATEGAIHATAGKIFVQGCRFVDNKQQVTLGSNVVQANITGNILTGTERITNSATGTAGNYVIANNSHN